MTGNPAPVANRALVEVTPQEFARHLTYPDGKIPPGRSEEIANEARTWFEQNSKPWFVSRRMSIAAVEGNVVSVITLDDGTQLKSSTLAERLERTQCRALYVVAVSAGAEVDEEIQDRWQQDRPDEAFALNAYAAAATEQLLQATAGQLCASVEQQGETLIQHYGPGYDGWNLEDQFSLMRLVKETYPAIALNILDSGLLQPQKSMLAVYGITDDEAAAGPTLVPCTTCSLSSCTLRRAAYDERRPSHVTLPPASSPHEDKRAVYAFPSKALKRWGKQYLRIEQEPGGTLHAQFLYLGSTCCDGGIPLRFLYDIRLETTEGVPLILDLSCRTANDQLGHRQMCAYTATGGGIMTEIESFKPLLGLPLSQVLRWEPSRDSAGCLCNQAQRKHRWLTALQTLHFVLRHNEENGEPHAH